VKILIVEDEFMVAMTLKALIHRLGYEVVGIADDVASAKDQAEQTGPQLALVDIQLARGSSGIDVASELTKLGVVCIFMTGNAPDGPQPELAIGCLSKPFSDKVLAAALSIGKAVIGGEPIPEPPPGLQLYHR
jgi:two-component system, response regulator PdtaR